ncbi:hypothetical protein HMPREF0580_1943 [Mobiluncus mulieris ATCC 35239]|uniref:Uncharacterized protein n=1 Tax=Mobiluncus mulieris ATCC 35239 TaxID=871571 RepID=E0QSS8_9ACTO|nr:hypothetical protein HMPREF0580_1943 [Mobiluncus mulieris ATCC 35239]
MLCWRSRVAQRFAVAYGYERSVKKDTVTVQRVTVSVIIGMAFPLRCKIRFNML